MPISHKKMTLIIVAIAMFMDVMDSNILNTAIPVIAHDFRVNPVNLKVALISYLLSFAIFTPTSGWFSDRFGNKNIFIFALSIFTLSSLCCGFSKTLVEIIIARFFQGIGGAFMISLGRLMVAQSVPKNELVVAMNTVITIVSMGVMIGPFVGGVIVQQFHWYWIFWINIIPGIFLILLSKKYLKKHVVISKIPFDYMGFFIFGGGLATLCFSLSEMSDTNSNPHLTIFIFALSLILLISYIPYAKKIKFPIIKLSFFQIRTFRISVIGNIFSRLGFGSIPFLLPLMQQECFHDSPQVSGLLLLPIAIGIIISKMTSIKFLRKLGYKKYLITNTVIVSIVLSLFSLITIQTPHYMIAMLTLVFGIFISMQYTALNSLAFSDIHVDKLSGSTSITSTVQMMGQTMGVAVGAIFLKIFSKNLILSVQVFHNTFHALGFFTLLSIIFLVKLKHDDGVSML